MCACLPLSCSLSPPLSLSLSLSLFSLPRERSLPDGHPEPELVVLVRVVDLRAKRQREPRVQALLQKRGDDPGVVDPPPQTALSQDVIVPHRRLRLTRVPVPHEIRRQHRLLAHLGRVRERHQPGRRDLAGRDRLIVVVPRREPDAGLPLPAEVEPLAAERERVAHRLQVVDAVKLPVAELELRLAVEPFVVEVHHHLREPGLLRCLDLRADRVVEVVL
mmetsp:Transcript_172829/g.420409  ORF Transcript_172829/g.420409 Transcript_172829/m.420409 type:complete len:219 (-) Transcript_172829:457-1113(-)